MSTAPNTTTPSIIDLFAASMGSTAGKNPNIGEFVEATRPPAGDYPCDLVEIEALPADFRYKLGSEQKKVVGVKVTFKYLTKTPLEGHNDRLEFPGRTFEFPREMPADLPENFKTAVKINEERLMGHLNTLLGEVPSNYVIGLSEAKRRFAPGGESASLLVRCSYDKDRTGKLDKRTNQVREYFTEYLVAKL